MKLEEDIWHSVSPNFDIPSERLDVWRIPLNQNGSNLEYAESLSPDEVDRAHRFHFDVHRSRRESVPIRPAGALLCVGVVG